MANDKTGRALEKELALRKEREGWNSWLTERGYDGRLQVDLLTTKPKSAPLMSADSAQLIQVTGDAKVQQGKVSDFTRHHPNLSPSLKAEDGGSIPVDSILAYSGELEVKKTDSPSFLNFEHIETETEAAKNPQAVDSEETDKRNQKSTVEIPEIPADIVDALFLGELYSHDQNPLHSTAGDRINLSDAFEDCRLRLIDPKTSEVIKVMGTDTGGNLNTSLEPPRKIRIEIEELPEYLNQPYTENQW